MPDVVRRVGSRALLVTPDRKLLLMQIENPEDGFRFWITPGGGIEPGESAAEGLLRELSEELGRCDFEVGAPVWLRTSRFNWIGQDYEQRETYFWIDTERFDPGDGEGMEPREREVLQTFRWWTADEIAASDETFAPRDLAALLEDLFANGPPTEPIETGL